MEINQNNPSNLLGDRKLSLQSQIVNILGFACHQVYVTAVQLCCYSLRAAVDNT